MAPGAHRGRPVAAAPCTPGLRPAKSPLRGPFDLSLQASGRAEAASLQNTALSPHPCGLPRPAGNVSAILRPSAPAVSARKVNKLTTGRTNVGRIRREPPPGTKSATCPLSLPGGAALARAYRQSEPDALAGSGASRHPASQAPTQKRVTNGAVSGRAMVVEAFSCGVPR